MIIPVGSGEGVREEVSEQVAGGWFLLKSREPGGGGCCRRRRLGGWGGVGAAAGRMSAALREGGLIVQGTFDHHKEQIHLQFRGAVSTGGSPLVFFAFFLQYLCAI